MTPTSIGIVCGAVAIVILMFSAVAIIALCQAADERKKQATLNHLDRLRREKEMEEDVYLADEPNLPAPLKRLSEYKFRYMACGHATYQFEPEKGVCLQCVLEGRQVAKDGGRQS